MMRKEDIQKRAKCNLQSWKNTVSDIKRSLDQTLQKSKRENLSQRGRLKAYSIDQRSKKPPEQDNQHKHT